MFVQIRLTKLYAIVKILLSMDFDEINSKNAYILFENKFWRDLSWKIKLN